VPWPPCGFGLSENFDNPPLPKGDSYRTQRIPRWVPAAGPIRAGRTSQAIRPRQPLGTAQTWCSYARTWISFLQRQYRTVHPLSTSALKDRGFPRIAGKDRRAITRAAALCDGQIFAQTRRLWYTKQPDLSPFMLFRRHVLNQKLAEYDGLALQTRRVVSGEELPDSHTNSLKKHFVGAHDNWDNSCVVMHIFVAAPKHSHLHSFTLWQLVAFGNSSSRRSQPLKVRHSRVHRHVMNGETTCAWRVCRRTICRRR
jgi:hypothetical protein